MKRLWQSSVFFRVLLGIFVFAWLIVLLPTFNLLGHERGTTPADMEKNFFMRASSNRIEISFFCKHKNDRSTDWNRLDAMTSSSKDKHTLAFHTGTVPSAVENSLAAVCGMRTPLRLYDTHKVYHVIDAHLYPGIYIVEEGETNSQGSDGREAELEKWERELQEKERHFKMKEEQERQKRERDGKEQTTRTVIQNTHTVIQDHEPPTKEEERGPEYWEKVRLRTEEDRRLFQERISRPVRQITPPASTYKLMYPNPMRHPADVDGNITFISGAINIGRRAHAGKTASEYKFEDDYLQIMRLILSWRKPVVMVMQRKYYEMLVPDLHDQAIVRIVEVEELRAWKMYPKIERIRKTKEWQQIAPWLPDSPQAYSDLYNPVIMHKVYWMKELCHLNPFETKYFMWVDCGVCTTYLTPDMMDFLSRRYEAMMEPGFLATNSPRFHGDEIQGFKRDKLEEYAGRPVQYIMKGGTFGGECHLIDKFVEYYDDILERSLDEGYLGTEESIYSIVFYKYPELFHEFKQERPEHPGQEALCLMNDRHYWIPAFKEKWIQ